MKKILVTLLASASVFTLASCGDKNLEDISILTTTSNQGKALIAKDLLSKVGYNVELDLAATYADYKSKVDTGDWDLNISGWTTVTGNPDYAVGALYHSTGDSNIFNLADEKIDELIEKARTETDDKYLQTYTQLEQLMLDNAYVAPLYSSTKTQGYKNERIDADSIRLSKSRSFAWEDVSFKDTSKNETDALNVRTTAKTLSLDPITKNDGTHNMVSTNQNVRLVNLTDDDKITSEASLSVNHAISDDNTKYYFILRDDINFVSMENGNQVDKGVVRASDVEYTISRMIDQNSVSGHSTYSLFESIKGAKSLSQTEYEALSTDIKNTLTNDLDTKGAKGSAEFDAIGQDNKSGKYEIIEVETITAFPQVLNFLAHQASGIISEDQVKAVGSDYGQISKGNDSLGDITASGPYIMVSQDETDIKFVRNEFYMPNTDNFPVIKNVTLKIISEASAALSSLGDPSSGSLDVYYGLSAEQYETAKKNDKIEIQEMASNSISYLGFNLKEGRKTTDLNLRKSIIHALDQSIFIKIDLGDRGVEIASSVTPLINGLPGYEMPKIEYSQDTAKEYLKKYQEA